MNTDLLRTFVEVVRQASYTKAAKVLYLSQPTVYQHVKALESSAGRQLVRQAGKRVVPTPDGKMALEQAVRILNEVNELLTSTANDFDKSHRGYIELLTGTTFGQTVAPLGVAAFYLKYPGVKVRVRVHHDPDEIDDSLLRFGYDGAFHSNSGAKPGLKKVPAVKDVLVCVVPPNHPLAGRDRVSASDLSLYGLISYGKSYGAREIVESWASSQGCVIPTNLELDNQLAIVSAVASGAGIAVVSILSALPFIRSRDVKPVQLSPSVERWWYFVEPVDAQVSRPLELLVEEFATAANMALSSISFGDIRPPEGQPS